MRCASASGSGARRAIPWLSARGLIVVGQVALSMVLLISATLMVESLARLRRSIQVFKPLVCSRCRSLYLPRGMAQFEEGGVL